ncbi:tRNA 4-thiouridine(8) synthase ThiI [bacterium]|nr:tRNA 4-thiouridine(8) synthase ThiI [bacterium]
MPSPPRSSPPTRSSGRCALRPDRGRVSFTLLGQSPSAARSPAYTTRPDEQARAPTAAERGDALTFTPSVLVCAYSEIALKGKNRPVFQRRLLNAMRSALAGEPVATINHVESRYLVRLEDPSRADACAEKLSRVFGLRWFSPAIAVGRTDPGADLARAGDEAVRLAIRDVGDAASFKVDTRRSDRSYPVDSQEISRRIGTAVGAAIGLPARMTNPDFTVHVLVLREAILVFTARRDGAGGLPPSSSGRICCLLSGGIDSPVAAWMLMRRGCRPVLVHVHGGRSFAEADTGKVVELARILATWSPVPLTLWMVPVVPYEERAMDHVDDSHDMIMFRRFMVKTGQVLARRESCMGLVTGDSLGQVASQTLPNLAAIGPDLELPVLRPLVGLDKETITEYSRRIGAYETSVQPYRDCCSLRSPHPVLHARPDRLLELSSLMDLDGAVADATASATKLVVDADGLQKTMLPDPSRTSSG